MPLNLPLQTADETLIPFERLRDEIYADYRQKTPGSYQLFARAREVLVGGVSGNLRYFAPYPFYMTHGQGCKTWDVDGNDYIDCFSGNGPLLLGHNHPAVVAAIDALKGCGSLPVNPPALVDCAELITQIVPCAERVRFLNTGTEAVMTAVRYARAFTGKNKVLKFYGHYHGQQDPFLFGLDPSDTPFSAGVPQASLSATLICGYGDMAGVARLLETDRDIAAVILDPAMHAGGLWGSRQEDLQTLRRLTEAHGVVLIFDEVITGCRLALGGAQEYFGVTPDLVTMAKALAAGEKLALVAGKETIMRVVDPEAEAGTPRVFQSGTVNDGTAALAATTAALKTYQQLAEQGGYQRLGDKALRLKQGLVESFGRQGIGCQVNQLASMLQIYLTAEPVTFESSQGLNTAALELFYLALINEGILLSIPTSNHIYLSFAHGQADIDRILQKVDVVLEKYPFKTLLMS